MRTNNKRTAVFISYRRDDSRAYAGRIYDQLSDHFGSKNVFMDVASIDPGINFVKSLTKHLDLCGAFVVVIGKQWSILTDDNGHRRLDDVDDFVRREIAAAIAANILIVPVLVGGARMPGADQLPEDIAPLAHRNALEISDSLFQLSLNNLVSTLQQRVSPYSAVPPIRKFLLLYSPRGSTYWAVGAWFFRAVLAFLGLAAVVYGIVGYANAPPSFDSPNTKIISALLFVVPILLVALVVRTAGSWCDNQAVRVQRRHLPEQF